MWATATVGGMGSSVSQVGNSTIVDGEIFIVKKYFVGGLQ